MASNTNNTNSPTGPSNRPKSSSASSAASAPAIKSTHAATQTQYPGIGANFAHNPQGSGLYNVNYQDEAYLQYMNGEEGSAISDTGIKLGTAAVECRTGTETGAAIGTETKTKKNKTPTQIYREEWVRRALNPAISDPRGDPSPIDFECAESQRVRERV